MYANFTPGHDVRIDAVTRNQDGVLIMLGQGNMAITWKLPSNVVKTLIEFLNMLTPDKFIPDELQDAEMKQIGNRGDVRLYVCDDGNCIITIIQDTETAYFSFHRYEDAEEFKIKLLEGIGK